MIKNSLIAAFTALAAASCSSASLSSQTKSMPDAARPAPALAPTLVTGRLLIDTDSTTGAPLPTAKAASGASIYLEGMPDKTYAAQTAGAFAIEVPDSAFSSAKLADQNVAWFAVYTENGKSYGIEQQNVVIRKGETTDLKDVVVTLTGDLRGNVSVEGAAQSDGVSVTIPGTVFAATTDIYGNFVLKNVPAAAWKVQAVKSGFDAVTTPPVEVPSGGAGESGPIRLTPK